ncbi:MAG: DEAD/DEAH box helicase family protein [Candidatus Dormibacteria bacterium]
MLELSEGGPKSATSRRSSHVKALAAARVARAERKQLRGYQREAVRKVEATLSTHARCQLIMASGTGKTLVATALRKGRSRILVLVPSLSLLKQTLEVWERETGWPALAVASDGTVADGLTIASAGLADRVTTDPSEIAKFLGVPNGVVARRLVVSTYQSFDKVGLAQKRHDAPAFDLVIADEAHHCAVGSDSQFAAILKRGRLSAERRVFMTATPRVHGVNAKTRASDEDQLLASMDDPTLFGPVAHAYNFETAIEDGNLTNYEILIWGIKEAELDRRLLKGRRTVTVAGRVMTDKQLLRILGTIEAMRDPQYEIRRMVTFHSSVASAMQASDELGALWNWGRGVNASGPRRVLCGHVNGTMSAEERWVALEALESGSAEAPAVLTNCRVLGEGVDIPSLDAIAFLDPRRSQLDIIQAVGRAIRKAPDKHKAYVIVPVVVPDGKDPDVVLAGSEFRRVWEVITAFRDEDKGLEGQFWSARERMAETGEAELPERVVLGGALATSAARPGSPHWRLAQALKVRVIGREERTHWTIALIVAAAREWVETHGPGYVPADARLGRLAFGLMLSGMRTRARTGQLDPALAEALTSISPSLLWDSWRANDERGLIEYQHYVVGTGRGHVPTAYLTLSGYCLGAWVVGLHQRHARASQTLDPTVWVRYQELFRPVRCVVCGVAISPPSSSGRPRQTCSKGCRAAAYRRRERGLPESTPIVQHRGRRSLAGLVADIHANEGPSPARLGLATGVKVLG